jgi:hypothetical protein
MAVDMNRSDWETSYMMMVSCMVALITEQNPCYLIIANAGQFI